MPKRLTPPVIALLIVVLIAGLVYGTTMARTIVWGDPTEYTFVAHVLGIAHPPGYAFFTILGKLFQTFIPFGDVSWRMHVLSATAATLAALFTLGTIRAAGSQVLTSRYDNAGLPAWMNLPVIAGLFGALSVLFGADVWQHGIHANPHIITATFLAANLFLLTRWAIAERAADRPEQVEHWLYAFSLSAGLGVTHHPLTVFAFPAYALFILLVKPAIWREWRTLGLMVLFALLGLAVWLYFPIRSSLGPPFGPDTMDTLDGFLDHVLARGLSESLPFYSLVDFPDRTVVFWTLLRLQYTLPVVALAAGGFAWLLSGRGISRLSVLNPRLLALLYGLAFLGNYLFTINLRAQDIMAYLLGPFIVVAMLAGFGALGAMAWLRRQQRGRAAWMILLVAGLFFIGPGWQLVSNYPRISLRDYAAAASYVDNVFSRFADSGEQAVLLNDWEHMTPLWYAQHVDGRWPDPADVTPVLVSTAQPWLESVFAYLPGGPVYLSNYRREIVAAGFRLRPDGPVYRVVEPGDTTIPETMIPLETAGTGVEVVAYELPRRNVAAGDFVPLALAMRTSERTEQYYVPIVTVGEISYPFTTDSHLITPLWEPEEAIIERFDFALPPDLLPGIYPVTVQLFNLSTNEAASEPLSLGDIGVAANPDPVIPTNSLATFRQRVGLVQATARAGGDRVAAFWEEPLRVRPGDTVDLTLEWLSQAHAEESYTVFVHLIDPANRPLVELDYTPLGGSAPTHLWIPKWLPGQRMLDPYRLVIPEDLPPGTYYIEVGLYEMVSGRRLHMADEAGNLIGDRSILGPLVVDPES